MTPENQLGDRIRQALFNGEPLTDTNVKGESAFDGVSALAVAGVAAAVKATARLCAEAYGQMPTANIDRGLVDLWCRSSFLPGGWQSPPMWDDLSKDYRTTDGWVRLHCNAPHHRHAARSVLNGVETAAAARSEIAKWAGVDLVEAIIDAGGCASTLFTSDNWRKEPQGRAVAGEPIVAWDMGHMSPSGWTPKNPSRPLEGLRILDLTRIIAGPVATRYLASLGADVLRVDPPGWSEGGNEIEMTLGKTLSELNLRQDNDRTRFEDLVRSAHVLVHGYRRDALLGLGFAPAMLAEWNPSLITVGLTAYGWTGPWAGRRGFDSLVQRSTGLAVEKDGQIVDLPYQVLDHATGYLMAASVQEALRRQLTEGVASHARLSLARQAMLLLDLDVNAEKIAPRRLEDEKLAAAKLGQREETSWGPGWRLPPPYRLDGVTIAWPRPAHNLRSDPPAWASEKA